MKMIKSHQWKDSPRSDEELAQIVTKLAKSTHVDSIICVTETGALAQSLYQLSSHFRLIVTTTSRESFESLKKAGLDVIRLPLHTADKYTQIRHATAVVLRSSSVSIGDFVVCAIGYDVL
jgi:pyruvate kinase